MKIDDSTGVWVMVYPIENLTLTDAVGDELRVNRVTFIRHSKLKRKCRSFGLPLYSKLKAGPIEGFFERHDPAYTFAIVRDSGKLGTSAEKAEKLISTELDVLALSNLYAGNVRPLIGRSLAAGVSGRVEFLAVDTKSENRILSYRKTPARLFTLDDDWHAWQKGFYFSNLLECVRSKNGFDKSWRETFLRAASLVSEGLTSGNVSFAFLHNMIALETILLRQGDEHTKELPKRMSALLGWSTEWEREDYPARIKGIYSKRCLYVHDGDISTIDEKDVEFTDHLLHNVFSNILNHPQIFPNKDSLVDFSEKVAAERVLGVPSGRSKYLPKTFRLTGRVTAEVSKLDALLSASRT